MIWLHNLRSKQLAGTVPVVRSVETIAPPSYGIFTRTCKQEFTRPTMTRLCYSPHVSLNTVTLLLEYVCVLGSVSFTAATVHLYRGLIAF